MRQHRTGSPDDGAAMSFEEIGKELGITRSGAWMAYKSAMRKLSRQSHQSQLEVMRQLAAAKECHVSPSGGRPPRMS